MLGLMICIRGDSLGDLCLGYSIRTALPPEDEEPRWGSGELFSVSVLFRHLENDHQVEAGVQWPHYEMDLAITLSPDLKMSLKNGGGCYDSIWGTLVSMINQIILYTKALV